MRGSTVLRPGDVLNEHHGSRCSAIGRLDDVGSDRRDELSQRAAE
jgi:hypothetical protein